jgi:hypothetical protein
MKDVSLPSSQRGVTLVVGLIMLVLITLIVVAAFMMSSTNLRSVGNMQYRDEAVSAGKYAIETVITQLNTDPTGGSFNAPPAGNTVNVDINQDGTPDFQVTVAAPTCTQEVLIPGTVVPPSSAGVVPPSVGYYNTLWDITATVTDATGVVSTGATLTMHQGLKVKLNQTQCNASCGPSLGIATCS